MTNQEAIENIRIAAGGVFAKEKNEEKGKEKWKRVYDFYDAVHKKELEVNRKVKDVEKAAKAGKNISDKESKELMEAILKVDSLKNDLKLMIQQRKAAPVLGEAS